jgi:hypothetical protein
MQRFSLYALLFACATMLSAQDNFSSTLPIIVINTQGTEITDEPKITARMGIIDNGAGERNALSDDFNAYDGFIGIEVRGSSSQSFPKVGYGLETRLADGTDNQVELLGFPIEEDFVLHGPYSDKSLIRNALAYHLARELMPYAPRIRMVEVVINNDYLGVYLFTEKVKRDRNRVDVKKLSPEDTSGNEQTGGYILKFDKFTGEDFDLPILFESNYNADTEVEQTIRFLYHYPKPENIVGSQRAYIESWMHNFEQALAGDDFLDQNDGYRQYVDLESFVDFLLINEISRNVDGYRLSTFMYKERDDQGGKLHMGPVWDFNLAFGNADYCGGAAPQGWGYNFGVICPDDFWQLPFWWDRLREDPDFVAMLGDRWNELRNGAFSDERLNATIDSLVTVMDDAPRRNFERWPVLGEYVWPNVFLGETYEAEIDYLKRWVEDRTSWMDGAIWSLTPVERIVPAAALSLQPNPTDGRLTILSDITGELFSVQVYDAYGRLVYSGDRLAPGISIDLSPFAAGIYLLQARKANGEVVTGRVVRR